MSHQLKRILLGSVCILALGLATAATSSPATAKNKLKRDGREHAAKLPFGDIPKGPLEIFVSINQQRLHFYSGGVHVVDAPVATGLPGHLTPLGVFSVIERDRYHHSNIYDNAPMPYMERITWSGVALHQGEGVGHQASHGCIRMPQDFSARLWQLQTMGMRVIIARPELRPSEFADPHLFVHREPTPTAAVTLPVKTAQTNSPASKTDAADPPAGTPVAASPAPANPDPVAAGAPDFSQPSSATAKPDPVAPAAEAQTAGSATTPPASPAESETGKPNNTPQSVSAMLKGGVTDAAEPSAQSAAAPPAVAPAQAQTAAPANPGTPDTSAPAAARTTAPAPGEAATAAAPAPDITAPIALDDVPLPLDKPAQIARGGGGPIAIFISRKEGRIYVRQNFTPVFDAPVKIEQPSDPLGTHVFTAIDYLPDHSTFRWTVTTLPGEPARAEEHWKYVRDEYGNRRRVRVQERGSAPAAAPAAETPQEALARIEISQDVLDQIQQLIVPGSSLVVSDQGLGPETGQGTDFIVIQR